MTHPLDVDEVRGAAEPVLELEGADAVEVLVTVSNTGVTRYANSQIIQNTARNETRAHVRVMTNSRVATASTTQLTVTDLLAAGADALEAARSSAPDPDLPGFPDGAQAEGRTAVNRYDDAAASAGPRHRADAVRAILATTAGSSAAGVYETSSHAFALFNSNGLERSDAYTRCVTTCLVDNGTATGWGEASSHTVSEVDAEAAATRAVEKAEVGRRRDDAEPGVYPVVLEPAATALLLEYLSYAGFGAKSMLEGESFLTKRRGERVGHPGVTVLDDVWHPRSIGIGFDFEGMPRRPVAVIENGEAKQPVTDLRTARALGVSSTGHNSGSTEFGPYAANVVMEAGDASLEELIAGVEEGFLVTRFHYVNILDRPETLLTGMTRDGTFRIRGGEVTGAVDNFRFAQSVLGVFEGVSGIGRELETFAPDYGAFGSTVAPALRVEAFDFATKTSH
jgi:predicted Zn-dependent protease